MGNKKGRTAYPENFKTLVIDAHQSGESYESIARRFKISAYSAKSWCGSRPEVNRRKIAPLKRGRPTNRPEELEQKVKRLEMEYRTLREARLPYSSRNCCLSFLSFLYLFKKLFFICNALSS